MIFFLVWYCSVISRFRLARALFKCNSSWGKKLNQGMIQLFAATQMKVSGGYNYSKVLRKVLNMVIFAREKHWTGWSTWLETCRGWVAFQLCHSLSLCPWANYLTGSVMVQFVRNKSGSATVSFLLCICLLNILKFPGHRHCVFVPYPAQPHNRY